MLIICAKFIQDEKDGSYALSGLYFFQGQENNCSQNFLTFDHDVSGTVLGHVLDITCI